MKAVMQFSSDTQYSSFFTMKIEEWSFIMDPLVCQWLTYSYQPRNESSSILPMPGNYYLKCDSLKLYDTFSNLFYIHSKRKRTCTYPKAPK